MWYHFADHADVYAMWLTCALIRHFSLKNNSKECSDRQLNPGVFTGCSSIKTESVTILSNFVFIFLPVRKEFLALYLLSTRKSLLEAFWESC